MNWTREKPKFTKDCILITAQYWKTQNVWEYALHTIIFDGYWRWLDGNGEEIGDIEDLTAEVYATAPLLLPECKPTPSNKMKNTTGEADYKHGQTNDTMEYPFIGRWWTEESPTMELRWVWRDKPHNIGSRVLQQKWKIVHIKNGIVEYEEYQWRDVPEGGEE